MLRAGGRIRRGVAQGGRHEGCRGLGAAAAVGRLARHHDAADRSRAGSRPLACSFDRRRTGDPESMLLQTSSPWLWPLLGPCANVLRNDGLLRPSPCANRVNRDFFFVSRQNWFVNIQSSIFVTLAEQKN